MDQAQHIKMDYAQNLKKDPVKAKKGPYQNLNQSATDEKMECPRLQSGIYAPIGIYY